MAQFTGSGDLILDGGNEQQASDLEFTGTGEMRVEGCRYPIVERIVRPGSATRVVYTQGNVGLKLNAIAGAVRIEGEVDARVDGVSGDVWDEGSKSIDIAGVYGSVYLNGSLKADVRADGVVTVDGGNNVGLDVNGTVELIGSAHIDVELRSVGEDFGLVVDGCTDVNADVDIYQADGHGVEIEDSKDVSVVGSVAESGQGAGSFDNVLVTQPTAMTSGGVKIGPLRSRSSGTTTRYGVNIASGVIDAIVDAIDFGTAADYGSGTLNNSGTNTRIGTNWQI